MKAENPKGPDLKEEAVNPHGDFERAEFSTGIREKVQFTEGVV